MRPASCKMGQTSWAAWILLFTLTRNFADAVSFSSLDLAVQGLPELSVLASQIDTTAPALAAQLRADGFVGTLFAPTNATLEPLLRFQKAIPASLMSDVLGMAVIPGPPLKLTDLVNGTVLTTITGKTVNVTITNATDGSGPIYYVNKARISAGNIYAGGSIIHQTFGLIVPPDKQKLVSVVAPKDVTAPSASINLSPEGPAKPLSSSSPPSQATPSPAVVTSDSTLVMEEAAPVSSSITSVNRSPTPTPAYSPSPLSVSTAPSPSAAPIAGPTTILLAPAAGRSPSVAPTVSNLTASPAAPLAGPGSSSQAASSPIASPGPSAAVKENLDILDDLGGSDAVGSDPLGSDTIGSDPVGSDTQGQPGDTPGTTTSGEQTGSTMPTPLLLPPVSTTLGSFTDAESDLMMDSSQMLGSDAANSTGTPIVVVPQFSAGSAAVAGIVGLALPVVVGLLLA